MFFFFLDLLDKTKSVRESCRGIDKFEIRGYMSFIKGKGKVTRYGRNPGGLVVYVKNIIDQCFEEMVTKKSKQLKKLIGYKWNDNYKYIFNKRLNDTAGRINLYDIRDTVTKGKADEAVNTLYGMIWRAGREMEIKTTKFQEWDYRYDDDNIYLLQ